MRKLIIGCGDLGLRVAQAWLTAGHEVRALTRSAETVSTFRKLGIEPILGDVTQPQTLSKLGDADTVLYAVGYDRGSGLSQRDVYVTGLENVLAQLTGKIGRFVHISSTSVYGQSLGEVVDETSPCAPSRPNGQVCLEAEQLVWKYFPPASVAPAANVLRLAGIYGPGRLLSRIESLRSGALLSGNPDAYLNLIHVADAVAAVQACEECGRPGEQYLIADDAPIFRREYYALLAQLVGAPPVQFAPPDPQDPESANLNKRCLNRKLHEELKLSLRFPTIREGLPDTLGAAIVQVDGFPA